MSKAEYITPLDTNFCTMLQKASPNFAYQILQLEIMIESESYGGKEIPLSGDIVKLVQLYMLAVEVLEDAQDWRYNYFNRKINSLMMKKTIVEHLHKATTGLAPSSETLAQIQKFELESKKSQHELQIYFQQGQFNTKTIKDMIKKEEIFTNRREQKIQKNINKQQQALEERIRTRRLRSMSGSKGKTINSHDMISPSKVQSKVVYKTKNYQGDQNNSLPPTQQKSEKKFARDNPKKQ